MIQDQLANSGGFGHLGHLQSRGVVFGNFWDLFNQPISLGVGSLFKHPGGIVQHLDLYHFMSQDARIFGVLDDKITLDPIATEADY